MKQPWEFLRQQTVVICLRQQYWYEYANEDDILQIRTIEIKIHALYTFIVLLLIIFNLRWDRNIFDSNKIFIGYKAFSLFVVSPELMQ